MTNSYFDIKKTVLEVSIARTNDRIAMIESALETARDSSNDDTKSSAGDKYETSREMIQQDINRYQGQLLEANKDLLQVTNIATTIEDVTDFVKLGSLVKTNTGIYFIATSIGALKIGDINVFAISPVSPIGQLLLNKKKGESFLFNKLNQTITGVY